MVISAYFKTIRIIVDVNIRKIGAPLVADCATFRNALLSKPNQRWSVLRDTALLLTASVYNML